MAEGEPKVTAVDVLDGDGHLAGWKREWLCCCGHPRALVGEALAAREHGVPPPAHGIPTGKRLLNI